MLLEFESELENYMSIDPEPYGRFTRAYIRSVFDSEAHSQWEPLWIATATDPQLRLTWGEWFNTQVLRHNEQTCCWKTHASLLMASGWDRCTVLFPAIRKHSENISLI